MTPYVKLRGWPEFAGLLLLSFAIQFTDVLEVPQLFGPVLHRPVFLSNFQPVLMAATVVTLLGSRWDEPYEAASRARGVVPDRAVVVALLVAAWALVTAFGLAIGVVPAHMVLALVTGALACGVVLALRCRVPTRPVAVVVLPVTFILCLFPWYLGEHTILGDAVGVGLSPTVTTICTLVCVAGAGAWIADGR
ncbi:hypothetical protein MTQ22_00875 [Corynebacterium bovis]|uniref:hypothetical protein n=1 Tax=Corynebacterium bovis TaxID=36808 RepID=UPI0031391B00